jgi:hypothetical protein
VSLQGTGCGACAGCAEPQGIRSSADEGECDCFDRAVHAEAGPSAVCSLLVLQLWFMPLVVVIQRVFGVAVACSSGPLPGEAGCTVCDWAGLVHIACRRAKHRWEVSWGVVVISFVHQL